jgi:hypothetical protein
MADSVHPPHAYVDYYRSSVCVIFSEIIPQENQVYLRRIVDLTRSVPIPSFARAKEVVETLGREITTQLSLIQRPQYIGRVTWITDQVKNCLEPFIRPQQDQFFSFLSDDKTEGEEMDVEDRSFPERSPSPLPPEKRARKDQS